MDYPSNSYKLRGISKGPPVPSLRMPREPHQYFYVRIEYSVWPEIYGDQIPIPFPTLEAALRFAQGNICETKPHTRVFDEEGVLVETFTYQD